MAAQEAPRVFLADDHAVVRDGLRAILAQKGLKVVGEASDGLACVRMCEALQPDLAILDIGMPLLNGIDAAQEILRACPRTRIILLTVYLEDCYVLRSLRAGVTGYVLKTEGASGLIGAIQAVRRGEIYLSPAVSRTVVDAYLSHSPPSEGQLSRRERQVLQLIAEGQNMRQIGSLLGISNRTAETHRARIQQKLHLHEVADLVRYAIRHGLVCLDPGSSEVSLPPPTRAYEAVSKSG